MEEPTNKYIVFVTPDLTKLPALPDILPQLGSNWQIQFLSSPAAAMESVKAGQCDVIFVGSDLSSDSGLDLLNSISRSHPHIIRFLCVKSPNEDLVMKCIWNSHRLFTYAPEAAAVRDAIQRALDVQTWLCNKRAQELVARMRTFPSLPTLYFKVLKELESLNTSVEKLAELVGSDLAITTKLIQVVNSAFYAQQRQISSIPEAIQIVGCETLKSLVLGIQAMSRMDKVKPLYFSTDKIWRHGLAVATLARRVAQLETNDHALAEEAFTAGLLHDIGKLVLASNLDAEYNGIVSLAQKRQIPLVEVELEVFGATHGDAAAYLAAVWGLPKRIVSAIALHHTPGNSEDTTFSPLTAVHIANVMEHERSADKDAFVKPTLDMDYLARLGVKNIGLWRSTEANLLRSHSELDPPPRNRKAPAAPLPSQPHPRRHTRTVLELAACLTGALILVPLVIWMINWVAASSSSAARARDLVRDDLNSKPPTQLAAAAIEQPTITEEAQPQLPDDTTTLNPPEPIQDRPRFVLTAILYRPPRSGALINGQTVYVGDMINGATVLGIERESVRILDGEQEQLLKVR